MGAEFMSQPMKLPDGRDMVMIGIMVEPETAEEVFPKLAITLQFIQNAINQVKATKGLSVHKPGDVAVVAQAAAEVAAFSEWPRRQ